MPFGTLRSVPAGTAGKSLWWIPFRDSCMLFLSQIWFIQGRPSCCHFGVYFVAHLSFLTRVIVCSPFPSRRSASRTRRRAYRACSKLCTSMLSPSSDDIGNSVLGLQAQHLQQIAQRLRRNLGRCLSYSKTATLWEQHLPYSANAWIN